jgi:putative membrane-bound dehydrogenase-like protein
MPRITWASLVFLLPALLLADTPSGGTHKVALNGHTFTLPAGFTIELIAGPPLVNRPIAADFDEQGRLYVTDSSGSNEKVQVQLEKKPHRVVRLEDSDGDGRFDRSIVFADRMMFPEGVMWRDGSLYVAAPPSIWKLTDTNGDGVADQRSEWFQGKTLTGCANDLHGPYAAPDGWIYWCKGAFAPQTYERPGRAPLVTRAAHIFRCRADGSGLEPVMTGGMDNPVDVVFTPSGERIFTTTFFQFPGNGRRDGLIHAVYGGVYGKDWEVIQPHRWTGPEVMPVLTHLGAAAPCGLHCYESDAFGPSYRGNLFACLFNMRKVTRHVLEPKGATFQSRDEDFLVSENLDFHPTDVIEDADGSLLVVDTGGWYKLCCPTSQLVKPDVLGAIYRVRRTGAPRLDDPRGLKMAWAKLSAEELAHLLGDARPAVRRRAVQVLAAHGAEVIPALQKVMSDERQQEARCNALWAMTRIDHADARAAVRRALADHDETVRQVALHSVSLWRDADAHAALLVLLKSPSLHNRRAAAEALGRIGDRAAVPALLTASAEPADRFLQHALTYALIEIGDEPATAVGLTAASAATRQTALIALDQMDGNHLRAEAVAAELKAAEPRLRETAWWIVGRHPEWGGPLAGLLRERMDDARLTEAERTELAQMLARLARAPAAQELLAARLRDEQAGPMAKRIAMRAMAQAGLKEAPKAWLNALAQVLTGSNAELIPEAVTTLRAVRVPAKREEGLVAALAKLGSDPARPASVRLGALSALPDGLAAVEPPLFAFLTEQVAGEQPAATRTLAADVLARARLKSGQLIDLSRTLKGTGPMEVNRLLDAFAQTKDAAVGRSLVEALHSPAARAALRADALKTRLASFGDPVQKSAEPLLAALNQDAAQQKARLDALLTGVGKGDIDRGRIVFNSAKTACVSCHAIGYLGGKIGPDLTHIGRIRTERDLLEAIVFPSASFVRGYEPVTITTRQGQLFNGLPRRDAPEEIVLLVAIDQEVRIARADIEEMQPGRVSLMPSGLDQQLSARDLSDLVAFLMACK